jgi:5-methylcytosine-specific restriction enzyme subunit McrC
MIELWEQYGYKEDYNHVESINLEFLPVLKSKGARFFAKQKENGLCFKFWKPENQEHFRFQTSYFVGVDWIEEGKPIYVAPKQNNEVIEIDYLKMLMDALNEETNLAHLEELVEIDFEKPFITIKQSQDLLR